MKKTQFKDAIRNIKKRIVSFLSLCLVVALGLGALLTTRYMGAGLEQNFSNYFNDRSFKDYEMISSLGVSEKSLEKIRGTEGVVTAEGVMQADGSITCGDKKTNVTVISMTKEVSVPELTDGSVPVGRSECMIGEDVAAEEGIKIGDKIKIALTGLDALDGKQPLYSKEFTVSGLMHHPDYLRRRSTYTVVLPLDAFDKEVTDGLYTRVFIRTEGPEGESMFSEAFFDKTEDQKQRMDSLAEELGVDRTKEMKDDAYAEIDEEWNKAVEQMEAAEEDIAAGEAELDARLADGRAQLEDAQNRLARTVAEYKKKIREGEAKIKKYRDMVKKADERLPKIKDRNKKLRKLYNDSIKNDLKEIASWQKKLDEIDKIKDIEKKFPLIKKLAQLVYDKQDNIRNVVEFFNKPVIMEIAEALRDITDGKIDLTKAVKAIASIDVDKLVELADKVINAKAYGQEAKDFIKALRENIKSTKEWLSEINKIDKYIKRYEENRANIVARLDKEEKNLEDSKKKLAEEERKYQAQIDAGWNRYYAEKAKYETELEEAKLLLEENREEAEKKLKEAKAKVEEMEPCRWISLDRRANAGFVDARSNLNAIKSAGNVFGALFMIVTAIVCLSTLIIIIEEQKTLVGTTKAFGFKKGEILGKYLIFGGAAALVGGLSATAGAFILSNIVQVRYAASGMYQTGVAKSVVTPGITLGAAALITAVTIIASIVACADILRSPASILMKGGVLKKNSNKKKKTASRGASLYSRLILRNMIDDKARVIVTIAIIAFSCMLMGMGISMKFAYNGMSEKQISDINKYDFRVSMNDGVSDKQEAKLEEVLKSNNTAYLPATVSSTLYKWDGKIDGLQLICADASKLGEFFAIEDPETREPIKIPESGVLIQSRMNESYNMNAGDALPLFDSSLKEGQAEIKGTFANYVGRTVVASPKAYKEIFGKKNEPNSFYVKLEGADEKKVMEELLAVTDDISFTMKDDFRRKFESVAQLYDIIVVLITGIAILISFMILTNLANIFLTRRKTELSVMRVNGFSIKQAKGYLTRETIITTLAGLALGVGLGALLTPKVIALMQQPDLEFVKSFHPKAWAIALAVEAVFALLINSVVFNKVKKLNLRDIA